MRVLLYSGGLDSTTLLYWTSSQVDLCLIVDYGQPHRSEIDAARAICGLRSMPCEVVEVRFASKPENGLLGGNDETAEASVVAGRNAAFVALAAMRGATSVMLGCNADDQAHYMDCRAHILRSVGIACGVSIELPFLQLTKSQIVDVAREVSVPIDMTVSCYRGTACGECAACESRAAAGAGVSPRWP